VTTLARKKHRTLKQQKDSNMEQEQDKKPASDVHSSDWLALPVGCKVRRAHGGRVCIVAKDWLSRETKRRVVLIKTVGGGWCGYVRHDTLASRWVLVAKANKGSSVAHGAQGTNNGTKTKGVTHE
jgi:hypothetical protein